MRWSAASWIGAARTTRSGIPAAFVRCSSPTTRPSTGVVQPIARIARAVAPTPLLVDSTSGLGGAELNFDEDNLAYALTGSQKALALPPGLAFAVAREDLLEQASGSFYFDLRRYAGNPPPFTPALPQLYALAAQVGRIAEEGIDARLARHQAMAERVWGWAAERRILADPAHRSPTVTCILDAESDALRARLSEQGFTIGNGYGKLKGKAFRIGHMGDQNLASLDRLLATIGGMREITPEEIVASVESGKPLEVLDLRKPEQLGNGKVDLVARRHFHNVPGRGVLRRTGSGSQGVAEGRAHRRGLQPRQRLAEGCGPPGAGGLRRVLAQGRHLRLDARHRRTRTHGAADARPVRAVRPIRTRLARLPAGE